jgi:uncharacterized protein (DUF362 family)
MTDKNNHKILEANSSRRIFLKRLGAATAGMLVAPYIKPSGVFAYEYKNASSYLAQVALTQTINTQADNYDPASVKAKVQYLFDTLGGISDVVKKGNKVAIKINLTGGSANATSPLLNGLPITEAMWTHPAVLQAVGELLIDAGVNGSDIYIVDSLWDTGPTAPFGASDSFGYAAVQKALGCTMVDLNNPAPYTAFVTRTVGATSINFKSFTMNQILSDVDVYVSIPKLKQHAEAGLTCSLKNQVGTVPKSLYTITSNTSRRQMLHNPTGGSSASYLPESICDLNAARPVNLAVVDGIKNAKGGEGVWIPTFVPYESHVLIAGKDPVATDSIGAYLMGLDCEAATLPLPGGGTCDNYLYVLNKNIIGTNQLNEIEVLGDGASLITSVRPNNEIHQPSGFQLCPNFPNPFNPSTRIIFFMPKAEHVSIKVFAITGQEIETLLEGVVPAGEHDLNWSATGLASGMYICRMQAENYSETIKMVYEK